MTQNIMIAADSEGYGGVRKKRLILEFQELAKLTKIGEGRVRK